MKDDKEKMDYAVQSREADDILSVGDLGPEDLSERQKASLAKYKDIFLEVMTGTSVSEAAEKFCVSRVTVYSALSYFKNTDLIADKGVNLAIALQRIRKRLKRYSEEESQIQDNWNPGMQKYLIELRKEIRFNEELEMKLLGLLKDKGESDAGGNKIIILNNIRGNNAEVEVKGEKIADS